MSQNTLSVDAGLEAIKVAPPLSVSGASLASVPLERWVVIATLVYTLLLIFGWLWKFFRDLARENSDDNKPA